MNNGFIQLQRQMLEWEWYDDHKTKSLFIHCLFKANYIAKKWRGFDIAQGEFITSYSNLAKELSLSVQNIRTSLNKLKSTGELTIKTTNKNTLIQVVNYSKYQGTNTQTNKQLTNNQQTTNKQLTTTNKDNNYNKDNNIPKISTLEMFRDWEFRDDKIFMEWLEKKNSTLSTYLKNKFDGDYIEEQKEAVILYCKSKNKSYKDYKSALQNFINKDLKRIGEYHANYNKR